MKNKRGFTLLEILLVVAAITILAGIVIVAINPNKQLGDTRNAQRRSDVTTILNAVYQYSLDNNSLPGSITTTPTQVCKMGATGCTGINLDVLTTGGKYLVSIPIDPQVAAASLTTGYLISQDANGRVTVSAATPEQGATISVSK